MPLLALDLFARIVTMRINAGPRFSALFTLWLSMMAAVGWHHVLLTPEPSEVPKRFNRRRMAACRAADPSGETRRP
jgi:hypothetical protein